MTIRIARLLAAIGVCLSIGGLLFVATKANAQGACGELAAFVDHLKEDYGEVVIWSGEREVQGRKLRTFLFQSPTSHTWTIIMAQGTQACVLATGKKGQQGVSGQDT
jgi:hypothetical protein